ncbi:DUF86 domain-containing protein [Patescibacteria group bacterium]|nr:DUF86 domain-containing protein [Patescibacteria group bacterium]
MVNKEFIKRKIFLIEKEFEFLKEFSEFSFQEIVSDFKKQAIVERLMERIIMRAIDINQHLIAELSTEEMSPPKNYKETFLKLADLKIYPKEFAKNISKSVGTRNILVHQYDEIDYSQIYSSISDCLKDYYQYCDYIFKFLEKN